jgi:two-component system phosphate regulon sensor histidine kinase PhoR
MLFWLGALVVALAAAAVALGRTSARYATLRASQLSLERDSAERIGKLTNELSAVREIFDGIGEGVLALNAQGRVVLANARFGEIFDVDRPLDGLPFGEVIRVGSVFEACDSALRGYDAVERFDVPNSAIEKRVEIRAIPISSEKIAAVAVFIDVTHLERLEQIRRDFISDFSHEVRTPLAGLASAVESFDLAQRSMTAEVDQQLRRIMARQLARLQRLVDDLSELSRIESGDLTLEHRRVDVRSVIDDLCEDFAEKAATGRIRFVITGQDVAIRADPLRMQQAFTNLIDNALKYGGEDSTIDIAITAEGGDGVVRIRDHGEGLPPVERERIFHRFYRVDKSRSQDVAGTGLGLAITKHLVLLHGGTIDVESGPGEGSTFTVRLPLHTQ